MITKAANRHFPWITIKSASNQTYCDSESEPQYPFSKLYHLALFSSPRFSALDLLVNREQRSKLQIVDYPLHKSVEYN